MPPFLSAQLQFVSNAGDKNYLMLAIWVATALYLYFSNYRRESLLVLMAALSFVFANLLKLIFRQPRPSEASAYFGFDTYGFPSSHTLTYTVFWGLVIYLAFKLTGIPLPIRIISIALSAYFICLVGISRVYLGQHFVWDVVGGYIFGLLYLLVMIALDKKL